MSGIHLAVPIHQVMPVCLSATGQKLSDSVYWSAPQDTSCGGSGGLVGGIMGINNVGGCKTICM